MILRGAQGVGHTLNTVHNGTGKVVGGVHPGDPGKCKGQSAKFTQTIIIWVGRAWLTYLYL